MSGTRKWLSRLMRFGALLIAVIALLGAGYFAAVNGWLSAVPGLGGLSSAVTPAPAAAGDGTAAAPTLTTIRSAADAVGTVTAAGNLELVSRQQAVLKVGGVVESVNVEVGDPVKAGDVLVVLDGTDLESSVANALLDLASAQNALNDLLADASASDVAVAEANLLSAQENLAEVKAGPSEQEIAAARSKLASATAAVADLKAGSTADQLTQLSADLRKAEIAVATAQTAYDKIAWQTAAGTSSEAADLQSATIDYEKAKAAYDEATAPASDADLESAYSTMQTAQQDLDTLLAQPTAADVASAEASVIDAQKTLSDLLAGADAKSLEDARLDVSRAELTVQSAAADLAASQLRAPSDGTVLEVNVAEGDQAAEGTAAVVLADVNQLQLTVNVAEVDIDKVTEGMPAAVTVDALPGKTFAGEVTLIAPSTDPNSSVVNYPLTVRLTDDNLSGARAGMTAVATLSTEAAQDGGWLVPANSIRTQGDVSQVTVMRNGTPTPVTVKVGTMEGEWVVVESSELVAGDQVVGNVASLINPDAAPSFGPGGGGGGGIPGGGGGQPGGGARPAGGVIIRGGG